MLKITALIHTRNDGDWLGRTLESLRPCDEFLVVDHGSRDDTLLVAREYGARILQIEDGAAAAPLPQAHNDWVIALLPTETLNEGLEASLFEWKLATHSPTEAFAVETHEEREGNWVPLGISTRLLNRTTEEWSGALPPECERSAILEGALLRFPKS
jgi:glycosyltransferase involved in cell wall biosynthesis